MADIGGGRLNEVNTGPKVWERHARDVHTEGLRYARDIGTVRLNYSRLNVFSTISKGDTEDFFKFKVASKGSLHLGKNIDTDTRIQVFNGAGRVIADSNALTGRHYDKYVAMTDPEGEKFDRGNYTIRIFRIKTDTSDEDRNYTLQLSIGTEIKHDYEVVEYEAKPLKFGEVPPGAYDHIKGSARTQQAQGLLGLLDAAALNFDRILSGAASLLFGAGRR